MYRPPPAIALILALAAMGGALAAPPIDPVPRVPPVPGLPVRQGRDSDPGEAAVALARAAERRQRRAGRRKALALTVMAALCFPGCATPAGRIAVSAARLMCSILDATTGTGLAARQAPVAFDVLDDGGVRAVYAR